MTGGVAQSTMGSTQVNMVNPVNIGGNIDLGDIYNGYLTQQSNAHAEGGSAQITVPVPIFLMNLQGEGPPLSSNP